MNLLESILDPDNSTVLGQLAKNFGIPEQDARKAVGHVVPALSRGMQRNASTQEGLDSLVKALNSGDHRRYVEEPGRLEQQETARDGKDILGHVFGNKDVSRNVAGYASKETGMSSGLLKKMLPVIAAVAMGALAKKMTSGGQASPALQDLARGKVTPQSRGALESLLDSDRDGSITDDLLKLASRFF